MEKGEGGYCVVAVGLSWRLGTCDIYFAAPWLVALSQLQFFAGPSWLHNYQSYVCVCASFDSSDYVA